VNVAAADPITGFKILLIPFIFMRLTKSPGKAGAKADLAIRKGCHNGYGMGVGEADGNGKFDRKKTAEWLSGWKIINSAGQIGTLPIRKKPQPYYARRPGYGGWTDDQLTAAVLISGRSLLNE